MNAFPTRIENAAGREMSPTEIFAISRQQEIGLSRMLTAYISVGLAFMLLPGTFLGVWNLFSISGHSSKIDPAWMQAHGHAQIFGWVATFILGIGFYSIPKLRGSGPFALSKPWLALALWVSGVGLRWFTNVYGWNWRIALPVSAVLEIAAFLVFFRAVSGHRPEKKEGGEKPRLAAWTLVVMMGTLGFLATLAANMYGAFATASRASSPAFEHHFDQKFLVLVAWGFLATTVWGFTARWIPTFIGLAAPRSRALLTAAAINLLGVLFAFFGMFRPASILALAGAIIAVYALRIFEPSIQPAKLNGVHPTLPIFIRSAYGWLLVAASLAIWAAFDGDRSGGIGGAGRHAMTVGFISMMIFAVGQRVLPAFSGMRLLFSKRLMFLSMLLASVGCTARVVSEVLAYPGYVAAAWHCLPISAVIELTAFALFALNLFVTFMRRPVVKPATLYSITARNSSIA
ncbi:MAG TPA: NnrS family protein [Terriglobales bacterium]|nr:NnrS family protein [Terriglobales bacterium]